jgi:hypothetical protein
MTGLLAVTALGLGCQPERATAPVAESSAKLSGKGGNPDCRTAARHRGKKHDPVALTCTIALPGDPITSTGKSWVDDPSGTYYLADRSNAALFVIDIASHTVTGTIGGFEGASGANGVGPSSITAGRRGQLWVSDGNSLVRLVDRRRGEIVASVSTAIAACGAECDRTNEIAYDPSHEIVLVSNPSPAGTDGYLSFISARAPYAVLGHLSLGEGTLEGQVWVPRLQRFLVPMQNPPGNPFIAVVNPTTMQVESTREYDCAAIPGAINTGGNNNLQVGPKHHLLAQLCGLPVILDVRTGAVLNVVTEIGTGDQDWYNPGDKTFYVFGQAPPGAGGATQSLGVIDAKSGAWLQNVPLLRGAYPAAWTRTNELLARVTAGAGGACADPGQGCVAVFRHVK